MVLEYYRREWTREEITGRGVMGKLKVKRTTGEAIILHLPPSEVARDISIAVERIGVGTVMLAVLGTEKGEVEWVGRPESISRILGK